jgi:hypothetical protein
MVALDAHHKSQCSLSKVGCAPSYRLLLELVLASSSWQYNTIQHNTYSIHQLNMISLCVFTW